MVLKITSGTDIQCRTSSKLDVFCQQKSWKIKVGRGGTVEGFTVQTRIRYCGDMGNGNLMKTCKERYQVAQGIKMWLI